MRSLHEGDPWKRFLWSFTSLEMLIDVKLAEAHDQLLESLLHIGSDGVNKTAVDLQSPVITFPRPKGSKKRIEHVEIEARGIPLAGKFALVALELFPDGAR